MQLQSTSTLLGMGAVLLFGRWGAVVWTDADQPYPRGAEVTRHTNQEAPLAGHA
jgi:hypothetical protein